MQPAQSSHLCLSCEDLSSTLCFVVPPSPRWDTLPTSHLLPGCRGNSAWGALHKDPYSPFAKEVCEVNASPKTHLLTQPVASWSSLRSLSDKVLMLTPLRILQAGSGRRGSGQTHAVAQQAGGSATMRPAPSNIFQSLLRSGVKDVGCHKS